MSAAHTTASRHQEKTSPFRQPGAVWAVAFACVISFMGIGLVDPILPALASSLDATPAQVSLLFTSYLVVTAIAMIGVGWVSSRIGAKWTLILGLICIVVFAALAGTSGSIEGIVGFRAGWGLGNAMFIATSLAVIVASASGGFSGAIVLYETALGLGIAVGPLLGGLLGEISWRGPFFGVAALMAIALIATVVFVPATPKPEKKTSLFAPIVALRHRGLLTMGIMALLYNWGFFTMLGYAPYPMGLSALHLGFVFTGWGVLVAAFSVFFAPRLQQRFGTVNVLYANMFGLAIVMTVIGIWVSHPVVVIVAVILSGAFIGINNTLTTQAVMLVAPVEPSVASSSYGFVRFIGGGLAPFVAGRIAEATDQSVAFWVGAAAFLIAIPVLASGHKLVRRAELANEEAEVAAPVLEPVTPAGASTGRPVIVAVYASPSAAEAVDAAAALATEEGTPLEIVHVRETEILGELAADPESEESARAAVAEHVARIARSGLEVRGLVLHSVGDHAVAGRVLVQHATEADARAIVIGHSTHGLIARLFEGSFAKAVEGSQPRRVIVVGDHDEAR